MDDNEKKCIRELADAAEQVIHLIAHPTPQQERLQDAIRAANELLTPCQAVAA